MTFPEDIRDLEKQKFVDVGGEVAVRTMDVGGGEVSLKDPVTSEQVYVTKNSLNVYPIETIEVKWTTEADFNKGTHSDTQTIAEQGGAVTLKGGSTTAYAVWHMNELSGTDVADSSGNSRDGTTINSPLWATGKLNNCLKFNGTNQYVNCGDIANFEQTQAFSLEAWINLPTVAGTKVFMARKIGTPTFRGWEFLEVNGEVWFTLLNNTGVQVKWGNIVADTWYHIIVTYNGNGRASGCKIYVNGENKVLTVVSDTLGSATILNTNPCCIASRDGAVYFTGGYIDEAIIYQTELTSSQVTERYNYGSGIEWTGLYSLSGTYTSNIYDSLFPNLDWLKIYFNQLVPTNTTATYKVRTSVDNITWGVWSSAYANGDAITEVGRYVQWKADLTTTDNTITPKIYDLSLTYLANPRSIVSP